MGVTMNKQRRQEVRRHGIRELTCTNCGKQFWSTRTAEEDLLDAIFGEVLCPDCKILELPTCSNCKGVILGEPIYYETKPYCRDCIDTVVP